MCGRGGGRTAVGGMWRGGRSGWRHGRPFFLAKRRIGEALIGVNPTLITVLIQSAMYIVRLEDPTARKLWVHFLGWMKGRNNLRFIY